MVVGSMQRALRLSLTLVSTFRPSGLDTTKTVVKQKPFFKIKHIRFNSSGELFTPVIMTEIHVKCRAPNEYSYRDGDKGKIAKYFEKHDVEKLKN